MHKAAKLSQVSNFFTRFSAILKKFYLILLFKKENYYASGLFSVTPVESKMQNACIEERKSLMHQILFCAAVEICNKVCLPA